MNVICSGFGMNRLKFKVQFSQSELNSYYENGHEAKCFLMLNVPVDDKDDTPELNTNDFRYYDSNQDEYNDHNPRTEISFEYIKKDDSTITIEFFLIFRVDEDIIIDRIDVNYKGDKPISQIFTSSIIPYYSKQIELILDKIFNRINQGTLCIECHYKFVKTFGRCHRIYKR